MRFVGARFRAEILFAARIVAALFQNCCSALFSSLTYSGSASRFAIATEQSHQVYVATPSVNVRVVPSSSHFRQRFDSRPASQVQYSSVEGSRRRNFPRPSA